MDTIAFDNATSIKGTSIEVSTNLTVASGRHSILIGFMMFYDWLSSPYMQFNSLDMTLIDSVVDVANSRSLYAYYLLDPPAGTYTLKGRWNVSVQGAIAGLSFTGVSRLKPPYFEQYGNASSTTLTTNTPTDGSLVVDAVWKVGSGTTITCGAGQTERFRQTQTSEPTYHFVGSTKPKDGVTTNMVWTFSLARNYLHSALVLQPAPLGRRFKIV